MRELGHRKPEPFLGMRATHHEEAIRRERDHACEVLTNPEIGRTKAEVFTIQSCSARSLVGRKMDPARGLPSVHDKAGLDAFGRAQPLVERDPRVVLPSIYAIEGHQEESEARNSSQ